MARSEYRDLDTDSTLGGENTSDIYAPSQKAVKSYVDTKASTKQNTLTEGTGIDITSDTISVDYDSNTLGTSSNSLQVIGVKTKSNTTMYDWVGTEAQWEAGRLAGTIPDDWFCWITDDADSQSGVSTGGGGSYVAGTGIDITNNVISVASALLTQITALQTQLGGLSFRKLTPTQYEELGTYYAYASGASVYYVRKAAPTTSDTVYTDIDTESEYTITAVSDDSITLSDGNTYTYAQSQNKKDETAYDDSTVYIVSGGAI